MDEHDGYRLEIFSQFPHIRHSISTKIAGSMKKDDGSLYFANILKFAKKQNFPAMPIGMHQVHETTVALVENNRELVLPQTDGMITNKKGLPLMILTADCLPVLFYDPEHEAIGVAHAGRKGLAAGIIARTIAVMASAFDSDPKLLIVGVGPSIEEKCYEVDKKTATDFKKTFQDSEGIVIKKEEKYFLDLRAAAMQSLQKEGILEKHIEISSVCTKCDKRFYSYRAGDTNGRFMSVLSLL